jgi:hypothetical protein
MAQTMTASDFSLVQGGLFYRLESRLRRPGRERPSLQTRTLGWTAIGWAPLLILSALQELWSPGAFRGFLADLIVHVRLLVAVPLFIGAEPYIDSRLNDAVRRLAASFVPTSSLPRLERAIRHASVLRDSTLVEGVLLALAYFEFLRVPAFDPGIVAFATAGGTRSAAGIYYLAVSLPLFRFLLLRWAWRAILWVFILIHVSRLPLQVTLTHPDRAGGLRFLGSVQASFSPIFLAIGSVFAVSTLHTRTLAPGELYLYAREQTIFAMIAVVLAFAPLALFSPRLLWAKRAADPGIGALALRHSRAFERKWLGSDDPNGGLPSEDYSSQADLGTTYQSTLEMKWFPSGLRPVVAVFGASMAPLAPVLMLDRQFLEFLAEVGTRLL